MNLKCLIFLYITIFLTFSHSLPADELGIPEVFAVEEKQFGLNVVRSLLDKLDIKDKEIKELLGRAAELEQKDNVSELQNAIINLNKPVEELKAQSCIPFANSSGIHTIKVRNIEPFNVLCGSTVKGSGWTVIQQRINGKEDFSRGWASYQAGFGSFDGDFFLGLEKIHRLTTNQRHELYIHLEKFNGEITYANYDLFAIAGENDQYKLIFADGFSGNETFNGLLEHKGEKFYTFDRDTAYPCAKNYFAGWWYLSETGFLCAESNLNGKYFDYPTNHITSNFWDDWYNLKKVQMLIRPNFN